MADEIDTTITQAPTVAETLVAPLTTLLLRSEHLRNALQRPRKQRPPSRRLRRLRATK